MRDAWHVNEKKLYSISGVQSDAEIENLKQVARKGTFTCPYCEASLYVRHGEINGTYFAHQNGEGCESSKQVTSAYKKYENQKKRESHRQELIVTLMKDELEVTSKVQTDLEVKLGYLDPTFDKYFPDLVVSIKGRKYALSVLTDINRSTDPSVAKSIANREQEFTAKGYAPIWFIERGQLAIDVDSGSLVFWKTEQIALQQTNEDEYWRHFLSTLATQEELARIMEMPNLVGPLAVKSIMYVTPTNEEIALQVYRVIEDVTSSPPRATFLDDVYTMSIAQAFSLDETTFKLSIPMKEDEKRLSYKKRFEKSRLERQQQEDLERKQQEQMVRKRENVRRETRKVMQHVRNDGSKFSQVMQAYKENN